MWLLLHSRANGSELLQKYTIGRIPDSFKVLDSERRGFREWVALIHFKIAAKDFPELLQDNPAVHIDPDVANPDIAFVAVATHALKKHLGNTEFTKSYELYLLERTNTVAFNYLAINHEHSEGFVVIIRY
jgi:hypothetical protein